MAINDNQKLDFLWKKLGYGVTKTDINSIKNATNESIPSSLLIRGDKLWAEAGDIPATIPTSNTSQVELTSTETTSDLTASENRTWKTSAADWIPPEFGSTYQVKVYIDSAGAANPQSTGTQLFAAGSGNNDEWFFDYQSGVLNFIGDNLPSGISGNKIYVVGARYIGNFGISGTSDGIIEGSNNLYYTDERVDDRVADLIVDGVGITKNYDDAGNLLDISINFTEFDSDDIVEGAVNTFLASRSTDAIPEGSTNLYYTDARTDARISLQSGSNLDLSNKTTTDLAEGTNLYFTDERVDDRVANLIQAGANISLVYDDIAGTLTISATEDNLANNTTDDLVEGSTNLYYTDARVQTYLTNNSYATIGTVTQQVAAQVGAIVSDLDDEIYDREQGDLNLQSQIDSIVTYSSGDFDTDFSAKTTTDLAEGTNLYYTDARFDTRLAAKSTTDVAEGTNLYYTQARFDSAFTAKSSTDLSEGTNLYYTEERVDDRVAALIQDGVGITKNYDDAGNLLNISIDFAEFDSDDIVEGVVNTFLASRTTDAIPEGSNNLYYTDARTDARIALQSGSNLDLSSKDTDELSEGSTNLYYTEARVDANIATKDTGDITEGSNLYYTNTRVQTKLGSVSGHIIPDTDVTYDLGSTSNKFRDLYLSGSSITLGSIELTDNGGSLEVTPIGGGSTETFATETYVDNAVSNLIDTAPTTLDTLNELAAALNDDPNFSTTITNLIGTKLATADFNTTADTWIGTKSTTDLTEGSNLYYTDSRVDARIALQSGSNLDLSNKDTDDLSEGFTNLYYTDARVNSAFDTRLATKSTTDLAEGTNLYYTDTRVRAAISVTGDLTYDSATGVISTQGLASSDTDDLSEGSTNLYYTDARVQTYLTNNNYATIGTVTQQVAAQIGSVQSDLDDEIYDREQGDLALQTQINSIVTYSGSDFDTDFAGKSTTDLTEGTNLYYTDARVSTYLSTNGFATETYVDNAVSNLIDTAPTTLDTLNELAAALNDDPNFSTTITNLIGTKLATADFNTTADTWIGTKSTTDLSEGTNLYYTEARVDARIALQSGSNLDLSNKDTDDLSEGSTNLYYTDSRADARVNLQTGANLDLSNKSTTNLVEGTNLYYTDARVDARISSAGLYTSSDFNTDFSGKSTTDLTEGTNLYYTDARVAAYLATTSFTTTTYVNSQIAIVNSNLDDEIYNREQADISLQTQISAISSYTTSDFNTDFATKDTDDLSEGSTNLYYTDARVDARITAAGSVTQSDIDSAIAALIDSAPGTLDTLNELAAALGDDANFSTTITNSIATKLAISDFNSTADTWLTGKSTSNLSEGTNLYYTDARVDARITASNPYTSADFDTDFSGKSTTDLAEGTNLYYTQARFDSALSSKSTTDLSEGNNLYYTDARVDARITNAGLFDGDYNSLTNLPTLFDGQFSSLTGKPTTLAGYGITDGVSTSNVTAIVTQQVAAQTGAIQSDLDDEIYDREQADIGLQNQINGLSTYTSTDFNTDFAAKSTTDLIEGTNLYYTDSRVASYLSNQGITSETTTTLSINGNILTYTDEDGTATNIDLSLYIDDTNLARLTSGSLAANGIATFTRDDASTFTIDFSQFFDDTNLSRINSATFTNGTLTLTRDDASTAATINLDGRYLQNFVAQTTDDLSEGSTNLYYTQARFDSAFTAKSTTDLIEGVNLYYTDVRVRTHVESQDLDLGTNKVLFSNMYANLVDLPSATSYHGMFAHVHATGKAYYAHGGSWIELANVSEIPTTYTDSDVDTHLNTSTATTGQTLIWNGTDYSWGTPPAGYADSDVDTHLNTSTATSNQVLSWDGTDYDWIAQSSVTTSVNPPSSPSNGDLWFDTDELKTYVYYNDGTSSQWVQSNPTGAIGGGGTSIEISDVAPTSPSAGDLWFDSDALKTFIYYDDGSGAQWIESSGGSSISDTDALFEGSTNLYYTDARVDTHLNVSSATNGQTLIWNGTDYSWGTPAPGYTSSDFDTDFATKSTTDVVEGTNLYYTDARVQTKLGDVSGHIIPDTDVTYDLGSLTHKFRDLYLSGNSIILGGITLTESSGSLLVTSTAGGANNTFATESYVDTAISNLVDTAPTTLDTLNELAAALGDDPNFATTITNLIGTKLATADFNTTADSWLTTKSTTNLSEGTNLYYTDARFDTRLSTKTTDNLTEGSTNLYYTDARADARVAYAASGALSVTYTPTIKYARLELTANQSISSATQTILNFNTRSVDNSTANLLTTTLGSGKFIIPAGVTKVRLKGSAQGSSVSDQFLLKITKNGSNAVTTNFDISSTGSDFPAVFTGIESVVEGDYFQVSAYSQTSRTVTTGSLTWFELEVIEGSILNTTVASTIELDHLSDVDTTTVAPTDGQALLWDNTNSEWKPGDVDVTSSDLDMGGNKVLFANMYATEGDLPNATTYHGMFAHVHATGAGYFAHAGSWVKLANDSQIVAQDFSWSSITGTPTTLAGYGITDGYVDADVDTHLNTSTATSNQVLSWDGTDYAWVAQSGGGGGGASVSVSDTAPTSPSEGDLWFNSSNTKMYVYFNDGTSSQWIQSNPSGATSPITASDTAPTNPVENSMWFDSTDGTLYFRYNDGTSEQWVNLIGATSSGGGSGGSSVTISDTAPTSPTEGDMWFDSRYAVLLVYYGTQWVNVSGESGSSTTPSWQETTNHTASAGDKLFIDCSGDVVTVTLPASPSMGDEIRIIDATGNASTNNITVARNGNNIQGVADNLTIDTDRAAFGLVYYNSTQGWLLMER